MATYAESLALFVGGGRLGRPVLPGRSRRQVEELLPPLDGGCLLVVVGVPAVGVMAQVRIRRHIPVGGPGACRGSLGLLQVVQLKVIFQLGERDDLAALLDGAFGVLYTLWATCRLGLDRTLASIFLDEERGGALGVLVLDMLPGICQRAPNTPIVIIQETRAGAATGGIEVSPDGSRIRPWSRSRRRTGKERSQA